jgi:hypothetical protein
MKQETIFKRENGDKVKVIADLYIPTNGMPDYRIQVATCAKGKRTWIFRSCTDDYPYRNLPFGGVERKKYQDDFYLTIATADEIQTAKLALWMTLKP